MNSKEKIKREAVEFINEAVPILLFLQNKLDKEQSQNFSFSTDYQIWYSKALKFVEFAGKDRLQEFRSYYEIDPKRKSMGYGKYFIQDFLKGVGPNAWNDPDFDTKEETFKNVHNQHSILVSLVKRMDSVLGDIQTTLLVELQDNELATASSLLKVNLRASGAVAAVVLESYLSSVVSNHGLILKKKNPTISDFNETLKSNGIYDTTSWRKISYLADIRNICVHKKDVEPTKNQVEDLISGVHWVTKNVF